jgi:uncharacterized membrane protein
VKTRHFLDRIEHDHIHRAIQAAEENTAGRIVVYIGHRRVADPLAEARRLFRKLGIESGPHRAGLLLFVAPKTRKFAVVGGAALHEKLGQAWWDRLAEMIAKEFREGNYTAGLLAAIGEAGLMLQAHFPAGPHSSPGPDIIEES